MKMTKEQQDSVYTELLKDQYKVEKYDNKVGIYCIKINGKIVYIGKSTKMLYRLAGHCWEIEHGKNNKSHKYRVLYEALINKDVQIEFDVMLYCEKEELDQMEGQFIRNLVPPLNYQIPKTTGKGYTTNPIAQSITLEQILFPNRDYFNF